MMSSNKKGDNVMVITGKDKGKTGEVLAYSAKQRVLVRGVNVVKRHTKPSPNSTRRYSRARKYSSFIERCTN